MLRRSRAARASRPLPAVTTRCPSFRNFVPTSFWLTALSSASRMSRARRPPRGSPTHGRGGPVRPRGRAEGGPDRLPKAGPAGSASSRSRRCPARRGERPRPAGPGDHQDDRRARVVRTCRDPLGQGEAVHLGHHDVEQHQARTALRPRPACRRASSASRPPSTTSASSPSRPAARAGCAGWWRCRRRPGRAGPGSRRGTCLHERPAVRQAEPRGEVERAAPARARSRPRSARPSARPAATRSPGPARCRRTGASSSRRPGRTPRRSAPASRRGCRCRCRATREVQADLVGRRPRDSASTRTTTSPALGELDGVADQVDEDLPQPAGVADQVVGDVGRDVAGQLQPLLVRRAGPAP